MIRQRAENAPDVLIRLAEKIAQLAELADAAQSAALTKHLDLVLNAERRGIKDKDDLQTLEARASRACPAD